MAKKKSINIISWNVSGIRAAAKKGLIEFLRKDKPDILCLQEIKIALKDIEKTEFDFSGYQKFWHPAERPGYSGTAILVNKTLADKVKSPANGLRINKFDREGRVQTMDLGAFYLVNAYYPNANHELSRLGYKRDFNAAILKYAKKLEKQKPVLIGGDYNVAHEEIDLARPKDNIKNAGFTPEERADMTKMLAAGFIDTFRHLHPAEVKYTWWSFRFNARARNIGWRVDYFCVSKSYIKHIQKAFIRDEVAGSDHCPVGVEVK